MRDFSDPVDVEHVWNENLECRMSVNGKQAADIDLELARDKRRPDGTDLFGARRPELYRSIGKNEEYYGFYCFLHALNLFKRLGVFLYFHVHKTKVSC